MSAYFKWFYSPFNSFIGTHSYSHQTHTPPPANLKIPMMTVFPFYFLEGEHCYYTLKIHVKLTCGKFDQGETFFI